MRLVLPSKGIEPRARGLCSKRLHPLIVSSVSTSSFRVIYIACAHARMWQSEDNSEALVLSSTLSWTQAGRLGRAPSSAH